MEKHVSAPSDNRRYDQLDALRGLAAVTVVFNHCMRIIPGTDANSASDGTLMHIVKETPLHLLWAGHQAVVFFFLLSGFVLSLPFHGARADTYGRFLVKRICRIWIPYMAAMLFALVARLLFSGTGRSDISEWVQAAWDGHLSLAGLLGQFSLIGVFTDRLDPVVWSLTIEMRISILFPLIMWFAIRHRWQIVLPAAFAVGALGYGAFYAGHGVVADLGRTVAYLPVFVVGILMAKYRVEIKDWYQARIPDRRLWIVLVLAVLAYTYPAWVLPRSRVLHFSAIDDWATTAGAVLFVVASLGSAPVAAALTHRIPMWLGRISYSLYLLHAVVLLTFVHLLYDTLPLPVIWGLTIAASLALATLSYRFVELPAIALGKRLTRRGRHTPPSSARLRDRPVTAD